MTSISPVLSALVLLPALAGCLVGEDASSEGSAKVQRAFDTWLDPSHPDARAGDVDLVLAWDGSSASIYGRNDGDHYVYVDVLRLTLWCDDASNPSIGSFIDLWPGAYESSQVLRCRDDASVISVEAHVALDP